MKKLDILALANTFAVIDLVLHPLFHIWGWFLPRMYESLMHEFVIGLNLKVDETFSPNFFIYWILESAAFWLLGAIVAIIYNQYISSQLAAGLDGQLG